MKNSTLNITLIIFLMSLIVFIVLPNITKINKNKETNSEISITPTNQNNHDLDFDLTNEYELLDETPEEPLNEPTNEYNRQGALQTDLQILEWEIQDAQKQTAKARETYNSILTNYFEIEVSTNSTL